MDRFSSSESGLRRSCRIARVTLLAALPSVALAAGVLSAVSLDAQEHAPRFAGEYGLAVFTDGDSLRIHWLTETAAPGALELVDLRSGHAIERVETPSGFAHSAAVRVGHVRELVLRYGEARDPHARHETYASLVLPQRSPVAVPAVDSLYLIGDTHGMHDDLVRGLRNAGLVDDQLRWTGGRKHLVFAGDLLDRGPDVLRNLWMIYRLEREAAAAGGAVHTVLGNHEIMVIFDDLRYVHPKELQIAELHGVGYSDLFDLRRSVLGRWLASKPALVRLGSVLVAHGGVDVAFTSASLQQIDALLGGYLADYRVPEGSGRVTATDADSVALAHRDAFFWADNSLFWHREYVVSDTLESQLEGVLRHFRSDVLVVGHSATPTPEARYEGRLLTAHTPRFGSDVVLLVRGAMGLQRYWISDEGTVSF